jgi:ribosomal protein L36
LRKTPYNGVLTAASIAASKEFKTNAYRAGLMRCCVLLPKSQLLLQKKLLRNFRVIRRSRVLVICSNWVTEQECGHTKV